MESFRHMPLENIQNCRDLRRISDKGRRLHEIRQAAALRQTARVHAE